MKILYIGKSREIWHEGESMTMIPLQSFNAMLESDPDLQVDFVVPNLDPGVVETFQAKQHPRLKALPINTTYPQRQDGFLLNQQHVDVLTSGEYDAVLNGKPAMQPAFTELSPAPVVAWHLWTSSREQVRRAPEYYYGDADIHGEALGLRHGRQVFESENLLGQCFDTLSEVVGTREILRVRKNAQALPIGVDTEMIDALPRQEQEGKPRVLWGGRFNAVKRPEATLKALDALYRTSKIEPPIVSTQSPKGRPTLTRLQGQYEHIDIRAEVGQGEFHRLAVNADVSLCLSKSESYGVAWLELLYAGIVVVYLREDWQKGVLPDNYPFVVNSLGDVAPMMLYVVEHLEEAKRYIWDEVRPWIRQHHDRKTNALRLLDLLREVSA